MTVLALYITFAIIINQDYHYQSISYAKWLFPTCNLKHLKGKNVTFEVTVDMCLHVIFILTYLLSIGFVKIVVTIS
jgi:hypothetical protein